MKLRRIKINIITEKGMKIEEVFYTEKDFVTLVDVEIVLADIKELFQKDNVHLDKFLQA